MRRKIGLFFLAFIILLSNVIAAGVPVSAEGTGDLYYLDTNQLYFDMDGLKTVYSSSSGADIRFAQSGSASYYFQPANGASIKDLGEIQLDSAVVPDSGYTCERVAIVQGHVYAVRCSNGAYGILKVTYYDSQAGSVEFQAKLGQPQQKLNLYYMSGDYIRFDFATMQDVPSSQASYLYFRYAKTTWLGENGTTIKDLGTINYDDAKAPATGYSTAEVSIIRNHVYALRSGGKYYLIKVTNVISESDVEFVAREAQVQSGSDSSGNNAGNSNDSSSPAGNTSGGTVNKDTPGDSIDEDTPEDTTEVSEDNVKLTNRAKKADLYWVENGVRFVLSDKVLFEDSDGIYDPFLSPNKKYVVYSNGTTELFLYDIAKRTFKKIYSLKDANYGVYAMGWSQDSKQVAFKVSSKKGYIGNNKLYVLTLSNKKTTVVASKFSTADWGRNGKFVIADGKSVWIVDKQGRNKITLKVPTAAAFSGADYVAFNYNATKVIYSVAHVYYLHDIKTNKYTALSIPKKAADNGTARIGKTNRIAVIKDKKIYIYDPADKNYGLLYDEADSSFPNWVN